jgi:phospholipase D1/2
MEESSGVKFHNAQVALARQWLGHPTARAGEVILPEVEIQVPQETTAMVSTAQEPSVKTERVKLPADEHEARAIIERFEAAARVGELAQAHNVSDNVVQHMMSDTTHLDQEQWFGTEEEELAACVKFCFYR